MSRLSGRLLGYCPELREWGLKSGVGATLSTPTGSVTYRSGSWAERERARKANPPLISIFCSKSRGREGPPSLSSLPGLNGGGGTGTHMSACARRVSSLCQEGN